MQGIIAVLELQKSKPLRQKVNFSCECLCKMEAKFENAIQHTNQGPRWDSYAKEKNWYWAGGGGGFDGAKSGDTVPLRYFSYTG